MSVLLIETRDFDQFYPIARTRFLWDISTGIYTPLQRYEKQFHTVKVYSPRFQSEPFSFLKEDLMDKAWQPGSIVHTVVSSQFIPAENLAPQINRIGITKEGKFVYLRMENITVDMIERIVNQDIEPLLSRFSVKEIDDGIYLEKTADIINENSRAIEYESYSVRSDSNFIMPNDRVYIDKTAKIQQFVSLQPDNGPIIIDKGAVIRSFSIIDGPAYIGRNTVIDSARIRSGTTVKDVCRIGGEVEHSIIESFSNKHHDGFIGHSWLGSWVNIGAMTTTSDLKNNYGNIRIRIDGRDTDTNTNKFGSIICDYSKLGIGMMLNTGTVIGHGCNLYLDGGPLGKEIPAFQWGADSSYEPDRFIEDLKKIMSRRNQSLTESREKFLRSLLTEKTVNPRKTAVRKKASV